MIEGGRGTNGRGAVNGERNKIREAGHEEKRGIIDRSEETIARSLKNNILLRAKVSSIALRFNIFASSMIQNLMANKLFANFIKQKPRGEGEGKSKRIVAEAITRSDSHYLFRASISTLR